MNNHQKGHLVILDTSFCTHSAWPRWFIWLGLGWCFWLVILTNIYLIVVKLNSFINLNWVIIIIINSIIFRIYTYFDQSMLVNKICRLVNRKSTNNQVTINIWIVGIKVWKLVSYVAHHQLFHPTTTFMLLHMKPNIKLNWHCFNSC